MTILRVLGIDPGSRVTGVGVVEAEGQALRHIHSACIRVGEGPLGPRLARIYRGVAEVIDQHAPKEVALEQVFLARNPHAALVLGHARGSALLAVVHRQRIVAEYSALEIKRAVAGTGRATKEQVQHMVKMLLGLERNPPVDAADALACAICHIHTQQVTARVSSQEQVG
jgi:crossover junction endodeoxyribonuclease RuvC